MKTTLHELIDRRGTRHEIIEHSDTLDWSRPYTEPDLGAHAAHPDRVHAGYCYDCQVWL